MVNTNIAIDSASTYQQLSLVALPKQHRAIYNASAATTLMLREL